MTGGLRFGLDSDVDDEDDGQERGRARDWLADEGFTPVRERMLGSAGQ